MKGMGSDLVLIRRMSRRDREALKELYKLHSPRVYGLALRLTGSEKTAEAVTTEVFRQAWERAPEYKLDGPRVLTWLLKVCRLVADRVNGTLSMEKQEEEPVYLAVPLDRERLLEGMGKLSEQQEQVLELLFYQRRTRRQAAEELGVDLQTITSQTHSAYLKLRKSFGRRVAIGIESRG